MADSPSDAQDDWTKLVMLSLAVLDEAADAAKRGPVLGTIGLRAALAALFWLSDQSTREPFTTFWRIVTGKDDSSTMREHEVNICRTNGAYRELHGICRSLGFEYNAWISHNLGVMRGVLPPDREARVTAAQAAMREMAEEAFQESVRERRERDREKRDRANLS
jgi:hypothetical protein